jgi:hypothetical protein
MSTHEAGKPFPRPCPECEGTRIVTMVGEADLRRRVCEPSSYYSRLFAVVCLQCGHTTLFADDLKSLRQQLEKRPKDFHDAAQRLQQQLARERS